MEISFENEQENESENKTKEDVQDIQDVLAREFHWKNYESVVKDPDVQKFRTAIRDAHTKGQSEYVISGLSAKDNIHKIRMSKNGKFLVVEFSATSLMAKYADALNYYYLESEIRFVPDSEIIHHAKLAKGGWGTMISDCFLTWTPTDKYDHVQLCSETDTFELIVKIPQRSISIALCSNPNAIHLTRKYIMFLCENVDTTTNSSKMCVIV